MADVIAAERIFEEVPIPRSTRTRRVLRYAKGQTVPDSDVGRLGVASNGTQKKVPLAEVDESGAVVPLPSTAASTKTLSPPRKAAPRKAAAKTTKARKR